MVGFHGYGYDSDYVWLPLLGVLLLHSRLYTVVTATVTVSATFAVTAAATPTVTATGTGTAAEIMTVLLCGYDYDYSWQHYENDDDHSCTWLSILDPQVHVGALIISIGFGAS